MNGESRSEVTSIDAAMLSALRFAALPPLSLYVHMPWCVRKCPYCDFNSHEWRPSRGRDAAIDRETDGLPEEAYVDALIADVEAALPSIWGRKVTSVFIGGGTPSLFSAASIDRLLSALRARLPFQPDCEITIEANPGTFEREKFAGFFAAGVNRLSLGIQSFDDAMLRALGRIHDAGEARSAIESALMIFGNVNLDLMFALPGQTIDAARRDAATALSFAPPHLSFYQMTLEPNTLFCKHPPSLPDEDEAADIEEAVLGMLAQAGYEHYETSAHAKPGYACRHNVNYWRFGDYLGIGAGAHSKISFPDRVVREMRWKQPKQYLAQAVQGRAIQETTTVAPRDLPFEFMLNALRLTDGVPTSLFAERTGLPLAVVAEAIAEATHRGLLDSDPMVLKPTSLGRRFLNDLQAMFLAKPSLKAGRAISRQGAIEHRSARP
ncbi:MAG TPA: radical SAM family heme chaperone HemW [Casimicrobiaceae bacterium]|nr:radical SAM family heme chaperone HemW [Casimicrobiaceae bacterium]